jgi:ribose 5-phosphate isomerase A
MLEFLGDNLWSENFILQEPIKDAKAAANAISSIPGVVGHGLFLDMATHVIIASVDGVTVRSKHS